MEKLNNEFKSYKSKAEETESKHKAEYDRMLVIPSKKK